MNGRALAFLVVGLGTPIFALITWGMLRFTFGPLDEIDWHYLALCNSSYPVGTALLFAWIALREAA